MYRIGQVAAELDLPPMTIRRWSERYAEWLSEAAGSPETLESGRQAPRCYSPEDVEVLRHIQQWQEEGLEEEAIEAELEAAQEAGPQALALVESESGEMLVPPQAAALGQAFRQITDTQQALVTTQQAHQELLSVVINDAMSLKDENERLRKRLRMMEEEMNRLKESDWNHRLTLEERMGQLERQLQSENNHKKRSWWEWLTGR